MPQIHRQIEIDEIKEADINKVKIDTKSVHIIPYKDWQIRQNASKVYEMPIEYCQYRLENGRIKTEIKSYETTKGLLDAKEDSTQKIIHEYLSASDVTKNENLKKILKKEGQIEPAIITADGFLINGNRRKWALTELHKETPEEKFKKLKVVILPGSSNPEQPTISDIATLENRLQVFDTGKSDYSKMNKALTYYSYVYEQGIPLNELLKDDPSFGEQGSKKFKLNLKKFELEHFETLKLMDLYLESQNMKGDYNKVANRWMSFEELAAKVMKELKNEKFLVKYGISKDQIGTIQSAAFNIIKIKNSKEVAPDNRYLLREIKGWLQNKDTKPDLLKIGKIEDINEDIKEFDKRDEIWQKEKSGEIIKIIKKIKNIKEKTDLQEDPLDRLKESFRNLDHEELNFEMLEGMKISDLKSALELTNNIEKRNKKLQSTFYKLMKGDNYDRAALIKKFNEK
jgi:hypothetical protein